jgi:hypothetical protein
MPQSAFRQFLFHLKWSLWVILVTCAAAGGIWWLMGRQGWFGVKPLPWMSLHVLVLMIAVAVFIPLTMLMRSNETRDLLQKCLLFSILLHVVITMGFSVISLSRDVINYVRSDRGMEVPINLEASRAAELQLQVRNQITNLPVATPQAGNDGPAQSAIEVAVEPPRPIQQELPKNFARPGALTSAPEAPSARPPKPDESVAVAMPSLIAPMPQLEIALPRMKQAEAQATAPPQVNPSKMELAWKAPAPQPMVNGDWPVARPGESLLAEIPLSREGTPKAEILDIHPRIDAISNLPQVTIPTLPVAPAIGGEVETVNPATAESTHVAGSRGKPGAISVGSESSANPIASLDQPASLKGAPSIVEQPVADALPIPSLETVKLPQPAASPFGSGESIAANDLVEPPRPSAGSFEGGTGTGRPGPLKASNLPPTTFDQWAPRQAAAEQIKPRIPDVAPDPIGPKVVASLPPDLGPKQMPAEIRWCSARMRFANLSWKIWEDRNRRRMRWRGRWIICRANQESDGRWTKFNSDRSPHRRRQEPRDMALTGLATLAFLASDHTPGSGSQYQDYVERALRFLLNEQRGDGNLRGSGGDMYDQAIATIALAEAAIMTGEPKYRRAAFKGADYILVAHNRRSGGWRYTPNASADTSVTGWCVMALHSAENAGFEVPIGYQERCIALSEFGQLGGESHAGGISGSRKPSETMTAQATFTRMLLGQQLTSAQIDEASRFVTRFSPSEYQKDFYHWYYVSLMLMQVQNDAWKSWNSAMTEHLLSLQRGDGSANGSWDSDGLRDDPGGRVYSTAMATLTLEVYYRYLPMYAKRKAKP